MTTTATTTTTTHDATTIFPAHESFLPFEFALPPTTQQQLPHPTTHVDDPLLLDIWLLDELQRAGVLSPTSAAASAGMSPPTRTVPAEPPFIPASPPLTPVKDEPPASPSSPTPPVPTSTPSPPTTTMPRRLWPVRIMPKTTTTVTPPPTMKRKVSDLSKSGQEPEEVLRKRQRNTDAARRSRMKKMLKMDALEKRVNELEGDNARLTTRVAVLESEKTGLENKDSHLQDRIRALEEQLADTHKALAAKCTH